MSSEEFFFNHTPCIDIRADFDNFKTGLVERLMTKYKNTDERQFAIDKIAETNINQAVKANVFCKEILPILWFASPPQNEADYCPNSQSIFVRIMCETRCNKELKVRSYFNGNIRGNPIKGGFLQSEFDKIEVEGLIPIIKKAAIREVAEESGIKLIFDDANTYSSARPEENSICSLNIYNKKFTCNYDIKENIMDKYGDFKHHITIHISCHDYDLLKKTIYDNQYQQKIFMEKTGEISGIVL